jgi:hypothetical protein
MWGNSSNSSRALHLLFAGVGIVPESMEKHLRDEVDVIVGFIGFTVPFDNLLGEIEKELFRVKGAIREESFYIFDALRHEVEVIHEELVKDVLQFFKVLIGG